MAVSSATATYRGYKAARAIISSQLETPSGRFALFCLASSLNTFERCKTLSIECLNTILTLEAKG